MRCDAMPQAAIKKCTSDLKVVKPQASISWSRRDKEISGQLLPCQRYSRTCMYLLTSHMYRCDITSMIDLFS